MTTYFEKLILTLVLIAMIGLEADAQKTSKRYSEAEVVQEQLFIDANREKLLGNNEKAIGLYREILAKDGNNHAAAYELARLQDTANEVDEAVKNMEKAVGLAPDNEWYQQYLADLYQMTGRPDDALSIYEKLADQHPTNEYYYFRWAYILVRANEIAKAVKVYDELEKNIGINEEVTRRKHALYLGTGDNKKAARELEKLIEVFPQEVDYHHMLAVFYEQIGEQAAARKVYERILQIDPQDPRAQLAMAGTTRKVNDEEYYLESLKPVFEQPSVHIDLKIAKLIPFVSKVAEEGDKALATAALALTDILEEVHPNDAKGFSAAGDLLFYSGRFTEAIRKYEETLQRDESVFQVWEQLMRAHLETRNYADLLRTSEETMDLFPNRSIAYYLNGLASVKLGKYDNAIDMLDQAQLMVGRDARLKFDITILLGKAYALSEKYTESDEAFSAALDLNPKAPKALAAYSLSLANRGKSMDEALGMAKTAAEIAPKDPEVLDAYGWTLYKMKEYKDAKKWLQQAIDEGGEKDPDILEHYGDVLFQSGDPDAAIEYWTKARDLGSRSALLEKKIADRQLHE